MGRGENKTYIRPIRDSDSSIKKIAVKRLSQHIGQLSDHQIWVSNIEWPLGPGYSLWIVAHSVWNLIDAVPDWCPEKEITKCSTLCCFSCHTRAQFLDHYMLVRY